MKSKNVITAALALLVSTACSGGEKQKVMATKTLDITKEHCPMTFVKTKIELSKLNEGDILEVLLSEGEPLDNVPRNAKEQGYNILSVEHVEGTTHKVTIKK